MFLGKGHNLEPLAAFLLIKMGEILLPLVALVEAAMFNVLVLASGFFLLLFTQQNKLEHSERASLFLPVNYVAESVVCVVAMNTDKT